MGVNDGEYPRLGKKKIAPGGVRQKRPQNTKLDDEKREFAPKKEGEYFPKVKKKTLAQLF